MVFRSFQRIIIASAYALCRFKWDCPIVLIGHSFGGLVLKSLVVMAKKMSIKDPTDSWTRAAVDRAKAFLNNVRGVVFYAVPHVGSDNIAKYVNNLLRSNDKHHARIMEMSNLGNKIWKSYHKNLKTF
jgi:triacylglycerol esterase/lipase EstA (alpha/beta hydrolase family)